MAAKSKKPEIRFAGFEDEWEQRNLGELGESFEYGLNAAAMDFDGEHKYIRITDIEDSSRLFLGTDLTSPNVDFSNADNYKLNCGDIVFARTGASVGKSYIYRNCDGLVYYAGFLIRLRIKKEFDPEFVFYNTLTNKYKQYIRITSQRSGQPGVNAREYAEYEIKIPNYEEQVKTGIFMRQLDNLITLQQKKVEKLKNIKSACMEKMFPQGDSDTPELRFSGFMGSWKKSKLEDVCQITMGQSPDGSTYSEQPSEYVLIQGNADLKNGWVEPRIWTTKKTKTASAGDLIMSVRAPAGAMGKTAYDGVIGRGVAAINGNEFIYQLLVKMDTEGYWKKLSCGSTFESLNSDNIRNADITIPSVEEQAKIGECFTQLDHIITLQQQKVQKLKNIKSACMEKMFV